VEAVEREARGELDTWTWQCACPSFLVEAVLWRPWSVERESLGSTCFSVLDTWTWQCACPSFLVEAVLWRPWSVERESLGSTCFSVLQRERGEILRGAEVRGCLTGSSSSCRSSGREAAVRQR
jgi:hypothetical protein